MAFNPLLAPSIFGFAPTGDCGPFTYYRKSRGTIVFFPRSPPKEPPTDRQIAQRNRFRAAAIAWRLLDPQCRRNWEQATKLLSLKLNGFNLFVWYYTKGDDQTLATIERQSGLDLHYRSTSA